jgi:hypothetical protein
MIDSTTAERGEDEVVGDGAPMNRMGYPVDEAQTLEL